MEDVYEKEMPQVDIAAFIRCLDENQNSAVINADNLLKATFQNKGLIDMDYNNSTSNGFYWDYIERGSLNRPSVFYPIILIFAVGHYCVQIAIDAVYTKTIQYRSLYDHRWSKWMTITLT